MAQSNLALGTNSVPAAFVNGTRSVFHVNKFVTLAAAACSIEKRDRVAARDYESKILTGNPPRKFGCIETNFFREYKA